ncbi:hypothetical protein KL86DYS2_10814 [uncultured Dysgonomonas sp.]|uniref:Uncharacterized protein n=1 Tax=uncultured Dysgonomonas sp. TaxID=206096 RepID=A0A212J636_9BACT|nr:hypothetical protein KL86DYS2_10814 [uncultured Dysgonomonas sp.]
MTIDEETIRLLAKQEIIKREIQLHEEREIELKKTLHLFFSVFKWFLVILSIIGLIVYICHNI